MKRTIQTIALAAAFTLIAPPLLHMASKAVPVFLVSEAYAKTPRFIFGRLKCARNVNAWLRLNGRRTTNSDASASFLRFPRVTKPRFGDVMYNRRSKGGGHVAIVLGGGKCMNPSQNKGWRIRRCASIWPNQRKTFVRP